MNIETLVNYSQALTLKEFGFNEQCYNFWSLEPDGKPSIIASTLCNVQNSDLKGRDITAPFLWQAQMWLEKEKGLVICPCPEAVFKRDNENPKNSKWIYNGWSYTIFIITSEKELTNGPDTEEALFSSSEEALLDGITECLKLLEKED